MATAQQIQLHMRPPRRASEPMKTAALASHEWPRVAITFQDPSRICLRGMSPPRLQVFM